MDDRVRQSRYVLVEPKPKPDEPKPLPQGKYDDALQKSLNDYFIKQKKNGAEAFVTRPTEYINKHIQGLVYIEHRFKKTSPLYEPLPALDSFVAALGHEKIADQLNISQLVNCARILEYLKSPELATKSIESVNALIQLVEDRKTGNIDLDKFSSDAISCIQQIRQAIPRHALAWLLLDKIAACVALIVFPIAIANGLYHKAMNGKFRLGFFDTQTPESKYIDHVETLLDQRPSLLQRPMVV